MYNITNHLKDLAHGKQLILLPENLNVSQHYSHWLLRGH